MSKKKITLDNTVYIYLLLGTIFSISSKLPELFIIESVLIFLYGVPTASLVFKRKIKNYSDIFVKNALFFVPVIILYFII